MEIMHKLQQGIGDEYVDYHLIVDDLIRFRDIIYVPDNSELKKLILREFHAKLYSGHRDINIHWQQWRSFIIGRI